MKEHDSSRREFLRRAAVGAGAVAGAGLAPSALAQKNDQDKKPKTEAGDDVSGHMQHSGPAAANQSGPAGMPATVTGHGAFLNHNEAAAIAAFTERLMPGAPGKPGALDAEVVNYIDLALAGAYADLQDFYRRGLTQLDAYCRKNYNEPFTRLPTAQQDETIAAIEEGKATEFAFPTAQAFFNTLRKHTMEGMFADPIYGGNKDFAGWRLVGFPGPQAIFTPADMKSKQAFTRLPIVGLQARDKMRRP
jgi:gluconate 2-dehydrogenase gamma chain